MGGFNFNFGTGAGNDAMKVKPFDFTSSFGGGAQNQYMQLPSLTPTSQTSSPPAQLPTPVNAPPPGVIPGQPTTQPGQGLPLNPPFSGYPYFGGGGSLTPIAGSVGAADKLPGGAGTTPSLDPRFTQMLDMWLGGQMGTGISPFQLQSYLPSTGGWTGAGQVAAPLNPQLQQLQQYFMTGQGGGPGPEALLNLLQTGGQTGALGSIGQTGGLTGTLGNLFQSGGLTGNLGALSQNPYGAFGNLLQTGGLEGTLGNLAQTGGLTGTLGNMAQTGSPISALPEWQAMVDAQKTNIAQNQANLKEQFASMGGLASSPAANAMALYNAQTSADQNSLLGQLQTQALEQAQGRALQAGEFGVGTQSQLGQFGVGNRLGLGEFGTGLQSNLGQFGAGLQAQLGQQGIQNQLASLLPSLQTQTSIGGELLGGGMNLGQLTQGLDQQSIQNLMQEYFMTTPQNNPLNNMMFGLGTTFAPTYSRQGGVGSGLVGSLGNLMSSGANFISSNPWGIFGS